MIKQMKQAWREPEFWLLAPFLLVFAVLGVLWVLAATGVSPLLYALL